ncbi:MAG TPA: DUF1570 domain-containing protein [Phycisphaerae bacterium]|nr:DUF1570 domain-containing protein [Phycisphaerae bacterium]
MQGTQITTEHFDIYTTVDDQEMRDYVPRFLEACYRQYADLLTPPEGPSPRMQTYLFANQRQSAEFTRQKFPGRTDVYERIGVGGFAIEGSCVTFYTRPRYYMLRTLAHEGLHQYFGAHFKQRIPAWLNEGMATYCEGFDLQRRQPVFSPTENSFRLNALREALSSDALIPLTELLSTHAGEVIVQAKSRLTQTYYAQVWALVVFLRHGADRTYAAGFEEMLADVAAGRLTARARAAGIAAETPSAAVTGEAVFRAYITDDLPAFEKAYRDYMVELAFR